MFIALRLFERVKRLPEPRERRCALCGGPFSTVIRALCHTVYITIHAHAVKTRSHVAFGVCTSLTDGFAEIGGTRDGGTVAIFGSVAGTICGPANGTTRRWSCLGRVAAFIVKLRASFARKERARRSIAARVDTGAVVVVAVAVFPGFTDAVPTERPGSCQARVVHVIQNTTGAKRFSVVLLN